MIKVNISYDKLKNIKYGLYPAPKQPQILEWLILNVNVFDFEYPVKHISRDPNRSIMPSWDYALFKNKNDALKFKLTWG